MFGYKPKGSSLLFITFSTIIYGNGRTYKGYNIFWMMVAAVDPKRTNPVDVISYGEKYEETF
jgi:hypothetical protein